FPAIADPPIAGQIYPSWWTTFRGLFQASILRAAGLSTLLAVGAELSLDEEDRLARALRDGALDTINESGQRIVQRQLEVPPTLTIRPGFPVRVIVTRDLVFAPPGG
ncbi:TrbI/VirB10 family protein, partial [Mesobacterium sp. TK19101]